MELPSKELLSEVLGFEIDEVFYYNDNLVFFQKASDKEEYNINIYELAHECKEWAWQNGHIITSFPTKAYWRVIVDSTEMFIMESEVEAVFKACQWILDNKDKQ